MRTISPSSKLVIDGVLVIVGVQEALPRREMPVGVVCVLLRDDDLEVLARSGRDRLGELEAFSDEIGDTRLLELVPRFA